MLAKTALALVLICLSYVPFWVPETQLTRFRKGTKGGGQENDQGELLL